MISFSNLFFTYPGADQPALRGVNLQIPDGKLCLVMGPSGSGKSTLLRCINGLVPHFSGGTLRGNIRVDGHDPVRLSPREMSRMVGFVFQDPEMQFVVDRVEDEIAFSLENAAMPREEMSARVEEALDLLDLLPLRRRRPDTLSGGEMQRVAIAAALALKPHILVLDEPTSQLDPHSAEEVLSALVNLNQKLNLTVVLAEHRLERVLPYAGQIIYLSVDYPTGLSGEPRQVLGKVNLNPPMVILGKALGWQPLPLTIEEASERARDSLERLPGKEIPQHPTAITDDHKLAYLQARDVQVSFGTAHVLRGVNLNLFPDQITVLMGPNGAGKTTLLRALIGLTPLKEGNVLLAGQDIAGRSVADICQQVGYLPQDPNALLFADTVMEELHITLRNHHIDTADAPVNPQALLKRLSLDEKTSSYPRDLSTGERQRVALGAVLVTRPGALLLDEPTRGLDYDAKLTLLRLLLTWRDEGMAILMVTHDVELAAQAADRIVILENGLITADGYPDEILSASAVFAPQVSKIFPGRGWLTVRDVIGDAYGG
jgi:energy-coupling factor transporter ATP-binding protein EcfA2